MVQINHPDTRRKVHAVVKNNVLLTPPGKHEVRELTIQLDEGKVNMKALAPGQSVGVLVPGPHPFGNAYHHRLYTVADLPQKPGEIKLCVKRCYYIDEISGEEHMGIASNYLCDLQNDDEIELTGPYGLPYAIPDDRSGSILMISLGTGIAPFRALTRKLYEQGGWNGKVRLFYGSISGLENLYRNEHNNDLEHFYSEDSFEAFEALLDKSWVNEFARLDESLLEVTEDLRLLLMDDTSRVYIAGLEEIKPMLDYAFGEILGSRENYQLRRHDMMEHHRWHELLY